MLRVINQIRKIATTSAVRSTSDALEDANQHANRLYVSNLPWTVGHETLNDYFTDFGPVIRADVVFNKETGISRGYGFVKFEFTHSYVKALQTENQMLEGRLLQIAQAKYGPKIEEGDLSSISETSFRLDDK